MGFKLSTFLPFRRPKLIDATPGGPPEFFQMEWTRGAVPQTGGQNYWLSSHQLPRYDLSGPLKTNAKSIKIAQPAPAIGSRKWANATIGGAGIVNGQVYSQPLLDSETGAFNATAFPQNAKPFNIFGILPAGVA